MKRLPHRIAFAATFLLLSIGAISALPAAERDAVVQIGGCSGFVVEGNLLVTAKHCSHPDSMTVTLQGKTTTAQRAFSPAAEDGPVVFRLDGGPYVSLPVANRKPQIGDAVYSLGYPGGNWARIEGKVIGGDGKSVNYTNHRIATGNSGGPLLNANGEVIGVALSVAEDITVHRSGFASWTVTTTAINAAKGVSAEPTKKPVVVVFSSDGCSACQALARDVQAGHFRPYEFRFVKWEARTRQWSDPALYREFQSTCQPDPKSLAFPTIWVKGTASYRVGYRASERRGLLGWIAAVVKHVLEGLFGKLEPEFPGPDGTPIPTPPIATPAPGDNATQLLLKKLVNDLILLRNDAAQTKSDLARFQESGVVGKIKSIARLKTDKDVALERVEAVRTDVVNLRGKLEEDPLQMLWGLLGIATGLIHRRFAV